MPPTPPTSITRDIAGIGGVIKQRPEDFFVDEQPLYEPEGKGEHLYLFIEKSGMTTSDAVHRIARAFRIRKSDVGYAGLKDKHAVTRQHFSLHMPGKREDQAQCLALIESAQMKVLWADRHHNKLRRGHLAGNRFILRIRDVNPASVLTAKRVLDRLEKTGVPNYFGPQRFGYRGDNPRLGALLLKEQHVPFLDLLLGGPVPTDGPATKAGREAYEKKDYLGALEQWPRHLHAERQALDALRQGKDPRQAVMSINPMQRDFFINALQSEAFNAVLEQRILEGTFDRLIPGDLAWKHDSRSVFVTDETTVELENGPGGRVGKLEVSPSGPMWGATMMKPAGRPLEMELAGLSKQGIAESDLGSTRGAAVSGSRRPMRVPVLHPEVSAGVDEHGGFVQLVFELPRGSYATVVLQEVMKIEVADEEEQE